MVKDFASYVAGELRKYVKFGKINVKKLPKHIGILALPRTKQSSTKILVLKNIIKLCLRFRIQCLTIYLLPSNVDEQTFMVESAILRDLMRQLSKWNLVTKYKMNINFFGNWYSLASDLVEGFRTISSNTRKNKGLYLNFLVNYDGQKEISDSVKVLLKQCEMGKLDSASMNPSRIQTTISSSNIPSPDLIIIPDGRKNTHGFLQWISQDSHIIFFDKPFCLLEKNDLLSAISQYSKQMK